MGVCDKDSDMGKLHDELTGALIGLARASDGHGTTATTHQAMIEGLIITLPDANCDAEKVKHQIDVVRQEKEKLLPGCAGCASPCGRNDEYDMNRLWTADKDVRSLKSLILLGLKGIAAYAYQAMVSGYSDEEINNLLYEGLFALGEDWNTQQLLQTAVKVGEGSIKCMQLWENVNIEWKR